MGIVLEFCKTLSIGEVRLRRIFLRLRRALLLRDTRVAWSEIAAEVGYRDAAALLHALGK